MLTEVNLNLYKYFFAVIEEKSVCLAAKKLHVSQPSVSYNIHELQRFLQEKLFTVERCGLVPLPRALELYQDLKPIFDHLLTAVDNFVTRKHIKV